MFVKKESLKMNALITQCKSFENKINNPSNWKERNSKRSSESKEYLTYFRGSTKAKAFYLKSKKNLSHIDFNQEKKRREKCHR